MKKNNDLFKLKKIAQEIALLTLDISYKAKTGHVGSALSISDILTVLYFSVLELDPKSLKNNNRDRFILSKGHAAAALYCALFKKGILSLNELNSFGKEMGLLEHPIISDKGVEMTSGSLGHGPAFGIGISYGLKSQSINNNVYVLISDGECGEGSVWEAALLAPRLKLDNLVYILDYNGWQCFGKTKEVTQLAPLKDKWISFGWEVIEVDGHDLEALKSAFERIPKKKNKPTIIIANTKSGKGVSVIENKLIGHYKVFTEDEYLEARKELETQ